MTQPFLDFTNYDEPASPEQYDGDMQTFLCHAPKTDGRLGFNPGSRFNSIGGGFAATTPYGMQVMEGYYVRLIQDFGVFNYEIVKRLCESPLPDASVLNLVDNAINYLLGDEPGELATYEVWPVAYIDRYRTGGEEAWRECGCDCFINGKKYSLEIASMLVTTGRVKYIPLAERFVPREECMSDFTWCPHPAAQDRHGNSLWDRGLNTIAVMIAAQRIFA